MRRKSFASVFVVRCLKDRSEQDTLRSEEERTISVHELRVAKEECGDPFHRGDRAVREVH